MERTNVWAKRAHSRDTRDSGDMKSETSTNLAIMAKSCGGDIEERRTGVQVMLRLLHGKHASLPL